MKWPWRRETADGMLVIGGDTDTLTWVHADGGPGRLGALRGCGVAHRGGDSVADFARRLRAGALGGRHTLAVLPLQQSQLLLIEAPAVAPEELRAASRWRIKEMVDGPLDDYTIDVLTVGDNRPRPQRQLFVAAARNGTLRALSELAQAAGWPLGVIEIGETAQRNLQTAMAAAEGLHGRATAALMQHDRECLLTICAAGELFYARRLDANILAPLHHTPEVAAAMAIRAAKVPEVWDIVDYGAGAALDDEPGDGAHERLVIELQRSFDVWERSWPELPLAGLWLQLGASSAAAVAILRRALGVRVEVLNPESALPGFDAVAGDDAELRAAVLPLLGALLRTELRQL